LEDYLAPIRGHSLACWCPLDQPCHADVLLHLANTTSSSQAQTGPSRGINPSRHLNL
jgi:hypothetical protein